MITELSSKTVWMVVWEDNDGSINTPNPAAGHFSSAKKAFKHSRYLNNKLDGSEGGTYAVVTIVGSWTMEKTKKEKP